MNKNTKVAIVVIGLPLGLFLIAAYKKIVPQSKPHLAPAASVEKNNSNNDRDTNLKPARKPTVLQANHISDDLPSINSPTRRANFETDTDLNFSQESFTADSPLLGGPSTRDLSQARLDHPQEKSRNSSGAPTKTDDALLPLSPLLNSTIPATNLPPKEEAALPAKKAKRPPRKQVTRTNDSFWSISVRSYGTGLYYRALYAHNRGNFPRPDKLAPGVEVDVPPIDELKDRYPKLCPTVQVAPSDLQQ